MTQVPRRERGTSTSVAQTLLIRLAKLSHSNPRVRIAIGSSVAAALVAAYAYRARCGGRRHDRARIADEPDSSGEQREASVADDPRSRAKRSRSKKQSAEKLFWFLLRIARPRVLAMAGLAVLRTMLSNRLSRLQGHLFRAAFLRKVPLFARNLLENVLLCAALSAVTSTAQHCLAQLHLGWRRTLSEQLHCKYFDNMTYYRLSHVDRSMALPEQHICEDVPKLSEGLADLVGEVLNAASDASFYSWRLRSYSGTNLYTLVLCAYILKAGTLMAVLAPNFSKLHKRSAQLEGRFRQLLSRLSANGEAVAFYGGLQREGAVLRRAFSALVGHKARLHRTQHRFGIVQDFLLKYLGATVAVVLIIGPFFRGKLKPADSVAGRAHMLSNMRYHTGVVISLFAALGTLAATSRKLMKLRAHADRVLSLQQRIDELHQQHCGQLPHGAASGAVLAASEEAISFEGVMVVTPSNTTLVKDLSLRVPAGTNLLVTGPNGAGKSSLFRVLGGLWPLQSGTIRKPGGSSTASGLSSDIFYVPQRPYVTVGSLQDQLIYPLTVQDGGADVIGPEEMLRLLRMVDLQHLLDWERTRLQQHQPAAAAFDWGAKLSLGEQQRLGMARLFYHRPRFAILDECTSGVTVDMELRFANQVKDMGCTCITISHRPALVDFHDLVLALDGEGGWSLLPGRRAAAAQGAKHGGTSAVAAGSECSVRGGDAEQGNTVEQAGTQGEQQDEQRQQQKQLVASAPAETDGSASLTASMRHVLAELKPHWRSARHRLQVIARLLAAGSSADGAQVAVIAVVVLLRTLLQDRIASLNGRTVKYVLMQDRAAFVQLIGVSIVQSACSSVLAPSLKYITESLALSWRKRATEAVLSKYLQGNGPYACSDLAGIQDAESRISTDIEWLTQDLAQLIPTMVKPAVDITWFSWQMWRLTGLRGLGLLYLYMALGFGVLRAVTPPFGQLAAEQLRLEAAFRSSHERLRTHAESVAFFGGGAREGRSIAIRLRELLAHLHQMVRLRWPHGAADDFFAKQLPHNATWALTLLYALDRTPNGLGRATDQGELVHDMRYLASVVGNCFSAFGELLALGKHLAELWGGVVRTTDLAQVARKCSSLRTGPWIEHVTPPAPTSTMQGSLQAATLPRISEEVDYGDGTIVFNGVDVVAPSGTVLARQLSLKVQPGTNLLVTGPNGSGKTSIFRLLRGIWPVLSGELTGPCHGPLGADHSYRIFHVPQRPYTSIGTLREQVVYPLTVDEACDREAPGSRSSQLAALDERLMQLMAAVRLQYLLHREGWDAQADDWSQVLSLGEQQRLGMARLFFHRPRVAVLDECTNATSVDVEGSLFLTASQLGITLITITQRTALLQYHHLELCLLDGAGDWQLRRIAHSPPTAAATLTDDTAPQLTPEEGC